MLPSNLIKEIKNWYSVVPWYSVVHTPVAAAKSVQKTLKKYSLAPL